MSVRRILEDKGREVVTLQPTATLEEATQLLARKKIGAIVLVNDNGTVAGIVSERDIVRVIGTAGATSISQSVRDVMTMQVTTCTESTSILEAMELMTHGRFRHLPVCEKGKLIGIISIGDVVKRRIEEVEREAREMREYIAAG